MEAAREGCRRDCISPSLFAGSNDLASNAVDLNIVACLKYMKKHRWAFLAPRTAEQGERLEDALLLKIPADLLSLSIDAFE